MTTPDPITVQPTVRAYAESLGEPGRRWLEALPGAVEAWCRVWKLQRGEALPGGSRSSVCRVTTPDGGAAVVKLALPEPILTTQIQTLRAAAGRGYVRLLAHDLEGGALLMEALGPPPEPDDVPAALTITAGTLLRAWQVPTGGFGPAPNAEAHKAATLAVLVRDLAGAVPGAQRAVERALGYACARLEARDPARQVLVHGDAHLGNLLRVERPRPGAESGYVFVDPEGFLCEPEYDLGVALREWNVALLAAADPQAVLRAWCEQLARASGTDPEAIWQWAYLERVSTGLYLTHHGLPALGAPFLSVAERLLD